MWENRNDYLHDELHPWQQEGEESTNITIQELYEDFQDTKYLEKDKKLFDTPMENKLLLTLRGKKSGCAQSLWLKQEKENTKEEENE